MKEPFISIIIPCYNSEKTLPYCLESVTNQTYKSYEIIVIDNNSSDNTKLIIDSFKNKFKNIVYVFEKNIGRGNARNTGIMSSKGKIIAMTDSDCIVPKDWLENLTFPIREENEIMTMGFQEDIIKNFWTKNIQEEDKKFIDNCLKGDYARHIDTKNFAVQSDFVKKIMFNKDLKNMEDFDFYFMTKDLARIRFLINVKVKHFHKNTMIKLIKTNFYRAYDTMRLYKLYKKQGKNINNEPMLECISLKNNLLYPGFLFSKFVNHSFNKGLFLLVSETSWRIGLLYELLKNKSFNDVDY